MLNRKSLTCYAKIHAKLRFEYTVITEFGIDNVYIGN